MEVALKAMKSIHSSHSAWHLKKEDVKREDISKLNNGKGALLALETTVASEISIELVNSMFTSGLKLGDIPRNYDIKREVLFKPEDGETNYFVKKNDEKQKTKKVDIVIRRVENEGDDELYPVLVELKRRAFYEFELGTAEIKKSGENLDGILLDIENLKSLKKNWEHLNSHYYNQYDRCLIYQMVWGEIKDSETGKFRSEFAKELGVDENNIHLKWLPIIVEEEPKVTKWIWISLIEIE